jgi:hypothetical protein
MSGTSGNSALNGYIQNVPNATASNSGSVSTIPNATSGGVIDYQSALLAAGVNGGSSSTSVPVDSTGMLQVWDLPKWLTRKDAPQIWYDTRQGKSDTVHVPAPGENGGPGWNVNEPHSFDIMRSATDLMKEFAAMSQTDPVKFAGIQKALADGNFYGSASSIFGGWNIQTEKAIASAMEQYLKVSRGAGTPVSFMQFLANTAVSNQQLNGNAGNGQKSGSSSSASRGPSLTDPSALRLQVQQAAQSALGRNLSESEVNRFVDEFHNLETQQFDTAIAGNKAYTNPNPSTAAESFVGSNNTQEAQQHNATGYMDALMNMFLPSSSAPPNPGIDTQALSTAQSGGSL